MDQILHGQRSTYQHARCRCTPCKAANAAYIADLRSRRLKGQPVLGVLVSAVQTRLRIRQLRLDGYLLHRGATSTPSIEQLGRWRPRSLQPHRSVRIRLSTYQRIDHIARWAMVEGADNASA